MTGLLIFDKDGTLVDSTSGPIANSRTEQAMRPGVIERLMVALDEGWTLAVASNQGGVAMGYVALDEAEAMVREVAERIGASTYRFCPFHPDAKLPDFRQDADCRKPNPGMLVEIMAETGFEPAETWFIGDRPEDQAAASAAGVQFAWEYEFFT
jgi:D-glycero-D-manno-heptose 1,7-bisphosphate phosphatase